MSSAALTTVQLPRLRALLADWEKKQAPAKPFSTSQQDIQARFNETLVSGVAASDDAESKDVIVAFRTRPPLENEAATKFGVAAEGDNSSTENADNGSSGMVEFCAGITLASAEPGVFVAHTPSMKVCRACN
jgi:kinesin family member 2/24